MYDTAEKLKAHREYQRAWRKANPRKYAAINKRAGKHRNKSIVADYNSLYKSANAEKCRAHCAVYYALKTGRLTRAMFCEFCRSKVKTEAHHYDYSQKLNVIWLCRSCHLTHHAQVTE